MASISTRYSSPPSTLIRCLGSSNSASCLKSSSHPLRHGSSLQCSILRLMRTGSLGTGLPWARQSRTTKKIFLNILVLRRKSAAQVMFRYLCWQVSYFLALLIYDFFTPLGDSVLKNLITFSPLLSSLTTNFPYRYRKWWLWWSNNCWWTWFWKWFDYK